MKNNQIKKDTGITYIYAYQNKINGMIYVGQTKDLLKRDYWHTHSKQLKIDKAINEFGRDNFLFWTIDVAKNIQEANILEIYWIATVRKEIGHENVYNIFNGGGSGMRGFKHTPEAIQKMIKANHGKKMSEISKQKMSKIKKESRYMCIFTIEEEKLICDEFLEGKLSARKLGKKYGCNGGTICYIIRRNMPEIGNKISPRKFTNKQEIEICKEYLAGGITMNELAIKHNCGHSIISIIVKNHRSKLE
jgi:group I intron endonuclease